MNDTDKQLLIQDLCARLPYGVRARSFTDDRKIYGYNITITGITKNNVYNTNLDAENIEDIKPYLFPMSSMTEGQRKEYHQVLYDSVFEGLIIAVDWLNVRHFDYRGLLERGLAIDATGLNIYRHENQTYDRTVKSAD